MRSTRSSSCCGASRGACCCGYTCCCGGYPCCCGGGGPCASTATHKTLAIALAHRTAFIDILPTAAIRGPNTRGPHKTRFPAPNNKGTHTHRHTGRHTDTGCCNRNTLHWAVWYGFAHHTAARNRSDSPSGTLAAPPRWRPKWELRPGTSEFAPDKVGSGGPASPVPRRFRLK